MSSYINQIDEGRIQSFEETIDKAYMFSNPVIIDGRMYIDNQMAISFLKEAYLWQTKKLLQQTATK